MPKRKFINFKFLSDFSNKSTYIFLLNFWNLKQFFVLQNCAKSHMLMSCKGRWYVIIVMSQLQQHLAASPHLPVERLDDNFHRYKSILSFFLLIKVFFYSTTDSNKQPPPSGHDSRTWGASERISRPGKSFIHVFLFF